MLYYGNSLGLTIINRDTVVFNITSMREGLNRLNLVPPNSMGHMVDKDFDIAYANYIMGNDFIFYDFFQIIWALYLGQDVYLVFSDDQWSENMAESLSKLIQQRYGYNAIRIESFDDYIYACMNVNSGFNSEWGILNLDQDKDRFAYLSESMRIHNGGLVDTEGV